MRKTVRGIHRYLCPALRTGSNKRNGAFSNGAGSLREPAQYVSFPGEHVLICVPQYLASKHVGPLWVCSAPAWRAVPLHPQPRQCACRWPDPHVPQPPHSQAVIEPHRALASTYGIQLPLSGPWCLLCAPVGIKDDRGDQNGMSGGLGCAERTSKI